VGGLVVDFGHQDDGVARVRRGEERGVALELVAEDEE
jgi:hypothetical protein